MARRDARRVADEDRDPARRRHRHRDRRPGRARPRRARPALRDRARPGRRRRLRGARPSAAGGDARAGAGRPTRCCSAPSATGSTTRWRGALRPEQAILGLRKALGLFANFRPAICYPELTAASSLKPELVAGLDILIIRELTGDIYFGQPRGRRAAPDGAVRRRRRRRSTRCATRGPEIERIAHVAFRAARQRSKRLTSVDKANVLETFQFWKDVVTEVHADYPDVALDHMYVDNAAMQLVRAPKKFDVVVTGNMFGDILSDEAAMLTGSIGMLPSASLDAERQGPVRAEPRQRARHRRQGRRQSAGYNSVRRHDASLLPPPTRSRRSHRAGGAGRAHVRPAHGRHLVRGDDRRWARGRWAMRWWPRSPANRSPPSTSARPFVSPLLRPRRRAEDFETTRTGRDEQHGTHGIGRLARHGRLRAARAHGRRRRLRADRAALLQHQRQGRPRAGAREERDAPAGRLRPRGARSAAAIIITAQGGEYTKDVYPRLRAAGWNGYWIDAAKTLRMQDDAVIVLDPVNRPVIDAALARGVRNYIGGNCTVSMHADGRRRAVQGRPRRVDDVHDLPGGVGRRRRSTCASC